MNIASVKKAFQNGFWDRLAAQVQDLMPNLADSVKESKVNDMRSEEQELISGIKNAIREWENANLNFENAEDTEQIDYYSYQIKASEVKYQYLLRLIKEKGINTDKLSLPSLMMQIR